MKKIITTILSLLFLLVGVCFVGCGKPQTQVSGRSYYGVVQTLEDNEGLFVYIPEVGVCELPSYKDGEQQDITVKEGDLIRMDFEAEEVEFMERYPVGVKTPVKSMTVAMGNVELAQDGSEYILTVDYTQALKEKFLAYEKGLFDTVYFIGSQGVEGTDNVGGTVIHEYCTATIEGNDSERLSLRLHLGEQSIQGFLKGFATKRIGISPKDPLNAQPLVNFFEVSDSLQKSDIQKIETVEYAGSVSPAQRAPVEYKTSTLATDIDAVYTWLDGLQETLTEVTEGETLVEGGGEICLTVYTRLGTFKICEGGYNYLRIWDKYFAQEDKMPDIVGETVTYTFESYSDEAKIYMDIADGGVMVDTITFDFGGMVCKLSDKTFTNKRFLLVADIGELFVYDGTHFERNGIVYEIISDVNFSHYVNFYHYVNFSQIIAEYFSELENRALLMQAYEAKYPKAGKASVINYYGKYGSSVLVAMIAGANEGFSQALWTETVGGYHIEYCDGNRICVLSEGEFYTLTEAYKGGYLSIRDIADIYAKHREFYPYLYESEVEKLLSAAYEAKYPNAGKASVINDYGKYGSGALVAEIAGANEEFSQAEWTETVAGCEIKYSSGNRIRVLYEGEFYTLTEAYENGCLTSEDIATIESIYNFFANIKYILTIVDEYDGFFDKPTEEYFTAGTVITLRCYPIMDADLVMYINGERYGIQKAVRGDDGEYVWEYSFIMPAKNVTVTFQTSGGM